MPVDARQRARELLQSSKTSEKAVDPRERARQLLSQQQVQKQEEIPEPAEQQEPAEESFLGRLKVNTHVTPEMLLGKTSPMLGLVDEENRKQPISFTGESAAQAVAQIGGSLAGTIAGGPVGLGIPGSMAGFGVGTELFEGARRALPSIFGKPRSSSEIVKEIGINAAFDTVFGGLPLAKPAYQATKTRILESITKKISKPFPHEVKEAVKAIEKEGTKIPNITVGTPHGDTSATVLEDILATQEKQEIIDNVSLTARENLEKASGLNFEYLPLKESIGDAAQRRVMSNYVRVKAKEDLAWNTFRQQAGTRTYVEPILDEKGVFTGAMPRDVVAPVEYRNTLETIKEVKSQMEHVFNKSEALEADEYVKRLYSSVKTRINDLSTLQKHLDDKTGKVVDIPVKAYDTLKEIRNEIWEHLPDRMKVSPAGGLLQKISAAITKDLNEAYAGQKAGDALEIAKTLTVQRDKLFPKAVRDAVGMERQNGQAVATADPSKFFDNALTTPKAAAEFRDAIVGRKLTRHEIANNPQAQEASAALLTDFWDRFVDKKTFNVNAEAALKAFRSNKYTGLTRELLTAKQRAGIENWLVFQAAVQKKPGMAGKVAVEIRGAGAMLNVGTGVLGTIATVAGGSFSGLSGAATGGLGVVGLLFTGKALTRKILLNPSLARKAAGLSSIDPTSPKAKADTLKLLRGMKGAEFILFGRDVNGEEYEIGKGNIPDIPGGATREF